MEPNTFIDEEINGEAWWFNTGWAGRVRKKDRKIRYKKTQKELCSVCTFQECRESWTMKGRVQPKTNLVGTV